VTFPGQKQSAGSDFGPTEGDALVVAVTKVGSAAAATPQATLTAIRLTSPRLAPARL
jgi:hypothetical protein